MLNFAAESHVDRSIDGPGAFIQTNVVGTLGLLEAVRDYWKALPAEQGAAFRFLHVSTDEVYGTLGETGKFSETTPYAPNSRTRRRRPPRTTWSVRSTTPTGAGADHQLLQQLRPVPLPREAYPAGDRQGAGRRAAAGVRRRQAGARLAVRVRSLRGDPHRAGQGPGWRDLQRRWQFGKQNIEVVQAICALLDQRRPRADGQPRSSQITYVTDRPGHDRRYAIDASKLKNDLGWEPAYTFEQGITFTVDWYLDNQEWVNGVLDGSYRLQRIGTAA